LTGWKRVISRSLLAFAATLAAVSGVATAAPRPGSVDNSFGNQGQRSDQIGCVPASFAGVERAESGNGIRVIGSTERSSPELAAEGGRLIFRGYDGRGRLDRDVGGTGTRLVRLPGGRARAWGVARQPDGKLVVVGSVGEDATQDVFVARFYADGSLDAEFGSGGVVTTDLGAISEEAGHDVVVQPDGRVVVAASGRFAFPGPYGDPSTELVVLRYLANGTLDPGFASGGVLHVRSEPGGIGSAYFIIAGLGLGRDGTIFVGGETGLTYRDSNTATIARVRGDGSLERIVRLGGDWSAVSVSALSLDTKRGRIYLAGSMPRQRVGPERVMYAAAVRTENLEVDARFGVGGVAVANFPDTEDDGAAAVISDRRGRVVLAGAAARNPSKSSFAVARFTRKGRLDRTFGRRGLARVRFPYRWSAAQDVLEHPAGRLVVAGVGAGRSSPGYPPTGCALAVTRLAAR
jgi:uncharacterized delta-60 repeat protein